MKADIFMQALAALPTCDASGNYPINRPTDLDSYILRERVYQLAKRVGHAEPFLFAWRAEQYANL
jgi:hypothetical protein